MTMQTKETHAPAPGGIGAQPPHQILLPEDLWGRLRTVGAKKRHIAQFTQKRQIVFTNSGTTEERDTGKAFIDKYRISAFRICRQGFIWQHFSSDYWANPFNLDVAIAQRMILVELTALGSLTPATTEGKYIAAADGRERLISAKDLQNYEHHWRRSPLYHAYTDAQIQTATMLAAYLSHRYNILLPGAAIDYKTLFSANVSAVRGKPGIYGLGAFLLTAHHAIPHPQPGLLEQLKYLTIKKNNYEN